MSNNKMLVALLGVVAVLLAVIAGILIFKSPSSAVPDATATAPATANPTAANPTPAPSGPFDPAKATKVPAGMDPKVFVENYFKAIIKADYATAYNMLPVDKKQSYGSADAFGTQLKSYKASGYTMGKTATSGKDVTVEATLKTPSAPFGYTWTLEKYKTGYVVKSRTLSGMGQ
jgi:hypothetical protein